MAGGITFASLVGTRGLPFEDFLWIFSKNLEVFGLIPQFGMIYRSRKVEPAVAAYVLLLGYVSADQCANVPLPNIHLTIRTPSKISRNVFKCSSAITKPRALF